MLVFRVSPNSAGSALLVAGQTHLCLAALEGYSVDLFAEDWDTVRSWVRSIAAARNTCRQQASKRHIRARTLERLLDDVSDASDDMRLLLASRRWQLFAKESRPLEASLYLGLQQAVHFLCSGRAGVEPRAPCHQSIR